MQPTAPYSARSRGFSLVELMVGMTIGMLVVLAISMSLVAFEAQKRTTTDGSTAQENGLIALVQLEQQIRSAGAGFSNPAAFDCANLYSYYDDGSSVAVPAPAFAGGMAPVVISDGGAGPDTLTIRRGANFLGSIPVAITDAMPQPSAELNVSSTQGFADGDKILVMQGGNCTVMEVTQVQAAALKIQHNPAASGPSWNPPGSCYTATEPCETWPSYSTGAKVLNLGDLLVKTYSVNADHNLQMVDSSTSLAASQTFILGKDIVNVQAQYGVSSAAGTQPVSSWVDATGSWSALDSDEIKRIKAIRLTVVARSSRKENTNVTTAAPGGVDVSYLPDWQRYRYRVYTTIIPLRNIIWANV